MKEENTKKETFFNSKEEYYAFRNKWKEFLGSGKALILKDNDGLRKSPLPAEFHLFYSIARGKGTVGFKNDSEGLRLAKIYIQNFSSNHGIAKLVDVFEDTVDIGLVDNVLAKLGK